MDVDSKVVDQATDVSAKQAAENMRRGPAAVEHAIRQELRQRLHRHPSELAAAHELTFGERWAGRVARTSGNWKTILPYLGITIVYLIVNHWFFAFDQTLQYYTFIVSVLAIFLAQVILLFQNRQSDLESALAHNAYEQTGEIFTLQQQQVEMLESIHALVQRHQEILAKLDDMMIDVHTIIHQVGAIPTTVEPQGMGDRSQAEAESER
ncbi:MAG TPA: DUF1003 domain-containing protein [Chloroflexota bacterium]